MRIVELRRHAERDANEDLTANGLRQCALLRQMLEFPYDAYVVSPAKRARLTMAALGIQGAVVEDRLGPRPKPPFERFGAQHEGLRRGGMDYVTAWYAIPECVPLLTENGRHALAGVLDIAAKVRDGGRALAVSHGGTIEPFAVVALGRSFGDLFTARELGYCEGVRAFVHDDRIARIDVIRFPARRAGRA